MKSSADDWPYYYGRFPKGEIFAIGVITLNFGRLERIFREMFGYATGMSDKQTAATFHRVQNNIRINIIDDLLDARQFPPDYKAAVDDFCSAFFQCADTRNAIMHSFSPGTHTRRGTRDKGMLLVKYSKKSGNTIAHPATLPGLRRLADEMHEWCSYGSQINARLRNFQELRATGADTRVLLPPLPPKPLKPTEMNWQHLQIDPSDLRPPQSSRT